jgi:HSP20 family molecular chaperone IbpA
MIHAKKIVEEEDEKKNYVRRERAAKTFYRKVPLPKEIRLNNAKANQNNGIL